MLEFVNIGDRGSLDEIPPGSGNYFNSTRKDGCDDYALLLDPPSGGGGDARVWIYDGATHLRYKDPATGQNLSYSFPQSEFIITAGGMCGAGGKHLIGDPDYPDLVIGAPGWNNEEGRIYILDMKDFDGLPTGPNNQIIDNLDPATNSGHWGSSVQILGDFTGSATAEILVSGSNKQHDPGVRGSAYVINLENNGVPESPLILAEVPAPDNRGGGVPACGVGNAFGLYTATIGNILTMENGSHAWGRDGTPEFAVSDPMFHAVSQLPPGCQFQTPTLFSGFVDLYNSFGLAAGTVPTVVTSRFGVDAALFLGAYVDHGGDWDLKGDPTNSSWDVLYLSGRGQFSSVSHLQTYDHGLPALTGTGFPNFNGMAPLLTPTGLGAAHGNQVATVGDLDLDTGYDGRTDFAYVSWAVNQLHHEVHIVDGTDTSTGPAPRRDLYLVDKDPTTGRKLLGAWPGANSQDPVLRTTISRLGDVDRDGLDDFAIVSGFNEFDDVSATPTHTLLLVCGSRRFDHGLPPTHGNAILRGNNAAQRGSRISLEISGCPPFATGTLRESPTLVPPPIYSECGAPWIVPETTLYSFTCDAKGVAFFNRDLVFNSADANETVPGSNWHYQAKVDATGGTPCQLTNVWNVRLIDTSSPLDEYPGDS